VVVCEERVRSQFGTEALAHVTLPSPSTSSRSTQAAHRRRQWALHPRARYSWPCYLFYYPPSSRTPKSQNRKSHTSPIYLPASSSSRTLLQVYRVPAIDAPINASHVDRRLSRCSQGRCPHLTRRGQDMGPRGYSIWSGEHRDTTSFRHQICA